MSAPLPSPPALTYPDRRPRTRGECLDMPRPCPFLTCRHHLALDVTGHGRLLDPLHIENATPAEIHERLAALPHTCSLDAADEGPATLEAIGEPWGVSRERIRQIEVRAAADLARKGIILDLAAASNIDTSRTPIIIDDHRARLPRALPAKAPAREPTEPHLGMNPERMTAAMRRVQEESRAACPTRTVTLSAEEIARVEAEIAAKRNPLHKPRPLVTLDNFSQRRDISRQKAGAATASTTRINAPAKATTKTQPRQPSPPSTAPIELPPQVLPATIQSDDYPEVAVVSALPVDPSPTPPSLPMTRPDMRTRRGAYAAANHTALTNLQKIMAERGLSRDALSALARDAYPAHTPMSVYQGIVRAMNGTASPVYVWYRRLATILGVPLSDLCDDPVWLSAVAPEDSPVAAPHSHLPRLPVAPSTPPPAPPPPALPLPTHEDALAPLILAALTQAQRLDKRVGELSAVSDLLRREIDDLQQQLATRTKERDAATATLNDIKRRLA